MLLLRHTQRAAGEAVPSAYISRSYNTVNTPNTRTLRACCSLHRLACLQDILEPEVLQTVIEWSRVEYRAERHRAERHGPEARTGATQTGATQTEARRRAWRKGPLPRAFVQREVSPGKKSPAQGGGKGSQALVAGLCASVLGAGRATHVAGVWRCSALAL